MPNEQPLVLIDLTPEYKQNLRDLSKRYRNIRSELNRLLSSYNKVTLSVIELAVLVKSMLFIK